LTADSFNESNNTAMPKKADWLDGEAGHKESSSSFTINNHFARNYEQRKRKQEIVSLEQKKRQSGAYDDDSESSSEEEDENAELLTPLVEAGVMRTLQLIKERDPAIYDKDKVWFDDKNLGPAKEKKKKEEKVTSYKDYMRERIENAAKRGYASEEDSDAEDEAGSRRAKHASLSVQSKAYDQEQRDLRKAFLESGKGETVDNEEEDMFLKPKVKSAEEEARDAEEAEKLRKEQGSHLPENEKGALNRFYEDEGSLNNTDKFLRDYILNRRWDDSTDGFVPSSRSRSGGVEDEDRDYDDVEKAEEYEKTYNFRFEESGANRVVSYSRNVEGSMRRNDDTRKKERRERKDRKRLEKQKKREELKRLKNLKRQEMEKKLQDIEKELGMEGQLSGTFDMDLLEGDFDEEAFDKKMNSLYNEDYYNEQGEGEEAIPTEDTEALQEDNPIVQDSVPAGEGEAPASSSAPSKQKVLEAKRKAILNKHLEDMYELDYEDVIGGMPTRFKYQSVAKDGYGLSAEEILAANDSTLNQFVPLKKLAPYRDMNWLASGKARKNFRSKHRKEQAAFAAKRAAESSKDQNKKGGKKSKKKRKIKAGDVSESRLDSYGL
jgi:protein KRI1